jgi:formylmethanofuran dehydrogenase subunit C
MVVTNDGLEGIAAIIGASGISLPNYSAIGSGITTASETDTALENEWARNEITSIDLTTPKNVTWLSDFNSVTLSGLTMTEFGLLNEDTNGILFHRETLGAGSITFEGDVELQLQTTFRFV